jgi:hypothetical protein
MSTMRLGFALLALATVAWATHEERVIKDNDAIEVMVKDQKGNQRVIWCVFRKGFRLGDSVECFKSPCEE